MKKIFSLCINFVLLVITEAVPVKLIAGERSVVKKDGATHTISKYYVVPNDYNPNNQTDGTKTSQITPLRTTHSLYSKSMDSGITKEDQVGAVTAANNQNDENNVDDKNNFELDIISSLNDAPADESNQADATASATISTTESLHTERSMDPDDLGNLQVEPITSSININSSPTIDEINVDNAGDALLNEGPLIVENGTQTIERDFEDAFDDLILSQFGIAVHESYAQNLESFWKLIKLNIDTISDDDELLAKIERLSLLLNIFTTLYEAAQLQKPIDLMINDIIDVLQIPFVEKSNTNESQSETNISGDYDEECLRRCGEKRSKPQLDSIGTYLSEAEGREARDDLEQENLNLQRRQRGDWDDENGWVDTSNDSGSNEVTVRNQPTNRLRSQLLVPNNLNAGVSNMYNDLSSILTPSLNNIARENDIQEDPKSNQTIIDLTETGKNVDDLPLTIESKVTDEWPWSIEDKSAENLPWTIQTAKTDEPPWHIEDKKTIDDLPWTVEHRTTTSLPWTVENRNNKVVDWTIEDRKNKNVPWTIEDRKNKNVPWAVQDRNNKEVDWTIEDRKNKNVPWTIEDRKNKNVPWAVKDRNHKEVDWTIEDRKNKNVPWTVEDRNKEVDWTIEDRKNKEVPWTIEDRKNKNVLWTIEDRKNKEVPWIIEDRKNKEVPWIIEDRKNKNVPWTIEDRKYKNVPWTIEDRKNKKLSWTVGNKTGHLPITLYHSSGPSVTTNSGKILLDQNQPMTSTLHSVKNVQKPYHVYTYVINPATSLYEIPSTGNIVKVKPGKPKANLGTKLYSISTSHGGNKVVYYSKPSPSYESKFSLSKPSIDISSQPSNSQLKHTNYVTPTYDTSNEVQKNPSDLSKTPNGDYQPKYVVIHEPETNLNTAPLQPNILPLDFETNSNEDYEVPAAPEVVSTPGVLLPNIPSNPFETLLNLGNARPVSTASESYSADTSGKNPDAKLYTKPIFYNPNIKDNLIQQTNLQPGLILPVSSSSAYKIFPDDYVKPNTVYGGDTDQRPGYISKVHHYPEYTNSPDVYDEPILVYGVKTHKHPGLISKVPHGHSPEYTKIVYNNEPTNIYDTETDKRPVFISKVLPHSEYTNLLVGSNNPIPVYGGDTDRHPGLIKKVHHYHEYTNVPDDYDKPTPVYDGDTVEDPGLIKKVHHYHEYTNVPDDYDKPTPVYGEDTDRHPGLIKKIHHYHEYTNVPVDYDKPTPVYGGDTDEDLGLISKPSSHSGYTKLPNNPIADYEEDTYTSPGLNLNILHYPKYAIVPDDYDKPTPVYGGDTDEDRGLISKPSSHSEYTKLPNNPIANYEGDTYTSHGLIQNVPLYPDYTDLAIDYNKPTTVSDGPTKNRDKLLVSHRPFGQTAPIIQPSLIAHLHGNKPKGLNYLKYLKLKLAPTYRLFTFGNLLKLHDAVIKTIEMNRPDVYDDRGLINLRKIVNIILILAGHLKGPEGSNEWYEKIFYNGETKRHPLQLYVYNLIRQRWLHELMLVLYENNFSLNILQNPRMFSFLGSWQFPNYVQKFMDAEKLIQHDLAEPDAFDQTFSIQNDLQHKFATHTYHDLLDEEPEDLENYVTNNVIDSYGSPNDGIVLSIAGVEAEPDANSIINILQKYLHYKNFIEKQEDVIIRDNKIEMLKQIVMFLREKGYDAGTIANLIRKLYTAVYSTEGRGCQTHHTNFAKNMYDVILPVLRRSGR